jgi:hypothetical protein
MGQTLTIATGWIIAGMVVLTIVLGVVLRRRTQPPELLVRMRPHFWLGIAVPIVTLVHLTPSMTGGWAANVNSIGLGLATVAFLLAIIQASVGNQLRRATEANYRSLRTTHLLVLAGLVSFATGHVIANSGLLS